MISAFCWGSADHGQLFTENDEPILSPKEVKLNIDQEVKDIVEISCSEGHTLIVTSDGSCYACGCNDYGQIGHDSANKLGKVSSLNNQKVMSVVAGSQHSLALTEAGEVFSWGDNSCGQLGRGQVDENQAKQPKVIKTLVTYHIIQICSGNNHSLALSNDGIVFSWGANNYGQLGTGSSSQHMDIPQPLLSIRGIPVSQIIAGGNHCFILSMSGALFGWGRNSFGQLGVNDENDRNHPTQCKSLRQQRTVFVSCGEDHTCTLTQEGGVFTFGCGSHGQLGHDNTNNEILPRRVMDMMGTVVTQIACGRRHTLTYVPETGRIYSFGSGSCGQLGLGNTDKKTSPVFVPCPFMSSVNSKSPRAMEIDGTSHIVSRIFSGGNKCIVLANKINSQPASQKPIDFREDRMSRSILCLSDKLTEKVGSLNAKDNIPHEVEVEMEKIFSAAACLNASFLLPNHEHFTTSPKKHGLDMDQVRDTFGKLAHISNVPTIQKITNCLECYLLPSLPQSPPDVEALRLYLILPEYHMFEEPKKFSTLIGPFANSILNLDKPGSKVLDYWWGSLKPRYFSRILSLYKQTVIYLLQLPQSQIQTELFSRNIHIKFSLEIMKKLNKVNEISGQIIPYNHFYIPELRDKVDIRADYVNWVQQSKLINSPPMHFCDYPFVFDGPAKSMLLQTDAFMQMRTALEEAQRRNFQSLFLQNIDPVSPLLVLHVTRENIVQDTIQQLAQKGSGDLKKPLKVVFIGEEAIDEGGLTKEFFLLLLREILDPKYGMFKFYEESRVDWFNSDSFEEPVMFYLIGCLCGLAIYNSTIIVLNFPLALYKKLLKRSPDVEDLKEVMPQLGRGLQQMMDYEEDDFEDVFCQTFEISVESFGEIKNVELCKGGSKKTVTKSNRKEYLDLYISYIFNGSIEKQYTAFSDGFLKVCDSKVLELFHPLELQSMVIGNENYDFHILEKNTEYKGEYHRYHPTIKIFWDVFHDLSIEQKKKFLLFLTGSDRIPILGMETIKVIIQPTQGGERYLPVAHTCFNILDLPTYDDKQTLKDKLVLAIEHTQGFGIV